MIPCCASVIYVAVPKVVAQIEFANNIYYKKQNNTFVPKLCNFNINNINLIGKIDI